MKSRLIIFLLILASFGIAEAGNYDASLTSGVFYGTPFWNREYLDNNDRGNFNHDFLRVYNRLKVKGELFDNFSLQLNGSRSDDIGTNTDLYDTRLYQLLARYDLKDGYIKAGRFTEFSRWLFGSVDGGGFSYKLTDNLKISGFGGLGVKYGQLFDDEDRDLAAYGDISYRDGSFGGKIKVLQSEDAFKSGLDIFGKVAGIRFSADAGYDFTNSRLFDGTLALYGYVNKDLSISGNISRLTPIFFFDEEMTPIDRFQFGVTHRIFSDYSLGFKQMVSKREDNIDYLSYLYLNHRYFFIGVNYLSGDSQNERLGLSLGGHYAPSKSLKLSAGFSSVNYLFDDELSGKELGMASYLRVNYKIFDELSLRANLNYYHRNYILKHKFRGGVTLQYRIKGGGK